jgi:hypothetical protein
LFGCGCSSLYRFALSFAGMKSVAEQLKASGPQSQMHGNVDVPVKPAGKTSTVWKQLISKQPKIRQVGVSYFLPNILVSKSGRVLTRLDAPKVPHLKLCCFSTCITSSSVQSDADNDLFCLFLVPQLEGGS